MPRRRVAGRSALSAPSAPAPAPRVCSASPRRSRAPSPPRRVYDVALGEGRELLGADGGMVALPTDDGAAVEMVATLGFATPRSPAGTASRSRSGRRSARRSRSGVPVFLDEGQRERQFPESGGQGAPTASVPLPAGGSYARRARLPLRARPRLRRCRARVRGHARRAVRPRARARPRVRRRATQRAGARPARGDRRAARALARARRRAAHARRARRAGDRRPVRRRPRARATACARLVVVNADPDVQEAARVLEQLPAGARQRDAGRGRDPHGRAAARRRRRTICPTAPTAAPSTGTRCRPSASARCSPVPLRRARAHARRADVRLAARARRPIPTTTQLADADRAPRRARARQQRALPGGARRARAPEQRSCASCRSA